MAITAAERQARAVAILERRNRYQFGQKNANLVLQAGCSDTNVQMIVLISLNKDVSLNNVRLRSGAPIGQPTTITQSLKSLASFGVPYEARSGLTARSVCDIARHKGPVFICYSYWSHPQWKGYKYAGRTLTGTARNGSGRLVNVGNSLPLGKSGLTQWTFTGRHSALVVGSFKFSGTEYAIIRDPNHNSPARPERPAYDLVTFTQLNRMLHSWGPSTLVLTPKKPSNPPPGKPDDVPNPGPVGPDDDPWSEKWLDPSKSGAVTSAQPSTSAISNVGAGIAILVAAGALGIAALGMALRGGGEDE